MGAKKCNINIVGKYENPFTEKVAICPTSPLVPIPEAILFDESLKTVVEKTPRIALEKMGGSHINGFLIIFGICIIEVPKAIERVVPISLSSYDIAAKPII